jgi:serine protease AprX
MMTSVVACGNGYLSGGLYRGIAPAARLVLVRLGRRIVSDDIRRGLKWVLDHRAQHKIRIVNISVGGDSEASYLSDELSACAEDAVRAGLVVVVAAGNSPGAGVFPPASVPAVITVGGVNDKNTLDTDDDEMYESSYGPTVDGLLKPEIVAPSIFLAAPILPNTEVAIEAELLANLRQAPNSDLRALLQTAASTLPELAALTNAPPEVIREEIESRFADEKLISKNYKHVDGTSFAAPIVSSVVAQMLEANPALSPQEIKRILIDTAMPLANVSINRQGWGEIAPARAVAHALNR